MAEGVVDMEAALVALVTAVPPTIAAVAAWRASKSASTKAGAAAHHVGTTNGAGTLARMVEDVIASQVRTEAQLGLIEHRLVAVEASHRNHADPHGGANQGEHQ